MVLGVVLAGGRSARMGQDKCALVLPTGKTLLQHSQDLLMEAGLDAVVISGPQPGAIADREPHLGPLGALDTVIDRCNPDEILAIPVDMPLLSPVLIRRLLTSTQGEARTLGQKQLPLFLTVHASLKNRLRHLLSRPDPRERSLHALLSGLDHQVLPISELELQQLANANTPSEWHRIEQLLNRGDQYGTQAAKAF